jgi:hypothetical protein
MSAATRTRCALAGAAMAIVLAGAGIAPACAFTDAALIDGFRRTVFGSEYRSFGGQAGIVKKFVRPVRLHVDDRTGTGRGEEVERFARSLPQLIEGLELSIAERAADANFRVFIADRASYRRIVTGEVFGRSGSSFAPGKCLVRILSTSAGIIRSDAVVVADEGEFLFRRCMVEELLQGLGPVNDDRSLAQSVFNDLSGESTFTRFDRHILNMLYDRRIRPGMSEREALRVLPLVAADVRRSLG